MSTVGLNEATIRKYIQEQESHDIAMDKLSVKEYEDPFKGGYQPASKDAGFHYVQARLLLTRHRP